ncbi:MAG: copper amine oxidase N-terminal domain-containing protein [Clostridiales bacterium]|nr:copper amine oxidase N-terminal domain-containing protein [Clostridiales bacterium]MCD8215022.1 copper amine oxidase N-terminal domain-containing protein [Clostridiales bacterium]
MKKFIAALAVAVMALSQTAYCDGEVNVVVNGTAIEAQGIIVDSTTLVPVRGVFEELGFEVSYDADTKTAVLENSKYTVSMTAGDTVIYVNGEEVTPPVPQQIYEGSFMLPLRTVAEAIGAEVDWDGDTKTATVTKSTGLKIGGIQSL